MPETTKMLVGLAGSAAACYIWERYPGKNTFKLAEKNPFAALEHYHAGLLSMITARYIPKKYSPYLDGLGAGLIVAEAAQPEPFGWNHDTFGASTIIGLGLASILALSF